MFKRFALAAVVSVAAITTSAAAQADDLHLKIGDLDLSQPAQVRVLDARIKQTAKDWCAGQTATGTRLASPSCEREARFALMTALPATAQKAYKVGMGAPSPVVQAAVPAATAVR